MPLILIAGASCYLGRAVRYNVSSVYDYKIFPGNELTASGQPFHFEKDLAAGRVPATLSFGRFQNQKLDEFLAANDTLAFLVLKDDRLVDERYFNGHSPTALSMSFSLGKSIHSLLIGIALAEGKIGSLDQPVTDYLPELRDRGFDQLTIRHCLQMTSGIRYKEWDNPFGRHVRLYYGDDIEKEILGFTLKEPPGTRFEYRSGDTMLLALILKRVLAPETITQYLQRKLWTPLGMEGDGLLCTDYAGKLEKVYCCLSARAVDFLKFGRLMLRQGEWDGTRIVPAEWVRQSTRIDESFGSVWYYQIQWWLASKERGDFMAVGHLGQYLYVNPGKNLAVLRLGRSRGDLAFEEWKELFTALAEQVR
ncbi:MAG: serine hydrolase [Myxococcales bacterium]|nr:serine hydrolase [Myxococcales bacterium]